MIRCSKCGTINKADASFCAECNAYLEWSGERIDDDGSAADDGPPSASGAPTDPPEGAGPAAASTASPVIPEHARAPEQPSSRKPERTSAVPKPKPKVVAPAKPEKPKPGELVCPNCGSGNDPKRKFCRRCGQDLVAAPVAVEAPHLPWYRRIFRRGPKPAVYEAGERPDDLGRRRRRPGCLSGLLILLVVLVIAAVAVYALSRDARAVINDVARTIECRIMEPVAGLTQPSLSFPGTESAEFDAFDASDDTVWVESDTNAAGRFIMTARFDEPEYLHRVEVTPAKEGDGGFPREVAVAVEDRVVAQVVMEKGKPAIIDVCRGDAQKVGFRVISTYEDAPDVAVARIAFRVRQ